MTVKPNGKVHPVAEMFPMMSEEELQELSEDIKANGLHNPCVLDKEGTLLDGRNRKEASELVGLEPHYTVLDGRDPVAFILSQNIARRHLNQSQKAMILAKANFSAEKFRGLKKKLGGYLTAVDGLGLVSRAFTVLKHREDLGSLVISGTMSLTDAYGKAMESKKASESEESKSVRLRKDAPDLYEQVGNGGLTLAEAIGALEARIEEERQQQKIAEQQRQLSTKQLETVLELCDVRNGTIEQKVERFQRLYDRRFSQIEITKERLATCAKVLKQLSDNWK